LIFLWARRHFWKNRTTFQERLMSCDLN
jgi:hypothetical protein